MSDDVIDFSAIQPASGYETMGEFATEVARLAELPEHEYERCRKSAAKALGVRVGMLDSAVKSARPRDAEDGGQGRPIELPEIELHSEPVDGAALILDLVAQIRRFIVLPDVVALAVALWVIFAHAHDAAFHSPRLAVLSPVHRCGKSTLLRLIGMLVVRKVAASSITASATFRMISAAGGMIVLLIDEFDQIGDAEKAGELIAVVNAGHCRLDAYVIRTVPVAGDLRVRQFECWAPAVVSSNKALPVTWMDRSIIIRMKRKARGDRVERLRDDRDLGFDALASRAARWAADHVEELRGADPALPAALNDRQADNWRMLVAIADVAGGEWGQRAREAAVALSIEDLNDAQARGELLLQDIRDYFDEAGRDRAPSSFLVSHLNALEGRPWHEFSRGHPLSKNQLANLLRPFAIGPKTIRIEDPAMRTALAHATTAKGYMREAFESAWNRYLAHPDPFQTVTTSQPKPTAASSDSQTVTSDSFVTVQNRPKATEFVACDVVTVRDPSGGTRAKKSAAEPAAAPAAEPATNGAAPAAKRGANGANSSSVVHDKFQVTAKQRAALRRRGVHPELISELRPNEARELLEKIIIPLNAERSPAEDRRLLAETLKDLPSDYVAAATEAFAARWGVVVDAELVDEIKAGTAAVGYAVRDAIWVGIS